MNSLVKVFLVVLAAALVYWLITILPVPHPFGIILICLLVVAVVVFILKEAGVLSSSS